MSAGSSDRLGVSVVELLDLEGSEVIDRAVGAFGVEPQARPQKTEAVFKISFARRRCAFSRLSRLISSADSVVTPGRSAASTCCRRIQVRMVSGDPIRSICAIAVLAAYSLG